MTPAMLLVVAKLRYLKQELGTWTRVGERLGVHYSTLVDIVNGRRDAGPKILRKLQFSKSIQLTDLDPNNVELKRIIRQGYGA